ncbi:hypothetical protein EYF80_053920 [Liparis tanakae]|uniref:Uncharacterized protein n=1 Tax=Liparis tanakae TaxID=230148 RepID=A0A4Z2F4T5_9TELE|nr:hypothetical protein EYF80_053920 [Liparis tanakae]
MPTLLGAAGCWSESLWYQTPGLLAALFVGLSPGLLFVALVVPPLVEAAGPPVPPLPPRVEVPVLLAALFVGLSPGLLFVALVPPLVEAAGPPRPLVEAPALLTALAIFLLLILLFVGGALVELLLVVVAMRRLPYALLSLLFIV